MRLVFQFVIIIFSLFLSSLSYAQISVEATLDQYEATLEDEIQLTVNISGSLKATEPSFSPMPAFKVIPSGTSSNIQIINGSMSSSKEYRFILIPQEVGKFTIGPISVFADGREYQSRPQEITIKPAGQVPSSQTSRSVDPHPNNMPTQGPSPGGNENEDAAIYLQQMNEQRSYWITAEVNNKNPYVNEQILYTFRFYTSVKVGSASITLPEFKDFWAEEVIPQKKYYKDVNGQRYVVNEKVMALFPLRSGSLNIDQTQLSIEVPDESRRSFFNDPFFGFSSMNMKTKNLKANPLEITVKPLPTDQPENFSNLVGVYTLETQLLENKINKDESSTLNIVISGTGNIKDAILPKGIEFDPFKTYDDKPLTETTKTEKGIQGKKIFKKALVPTRAGDFSMEPFSVSYFDPTKGEYVTLQSEVLTVEVTPSESESLNIAKSTNQADPTDKIQVILEDLATIHPLLDGRDNQNLTRTEKIYLALGLFLPLLLFVSLLGIKRRQHHRKNHQSLYRKRYAYKKFEKSLIRIKKVHGQDHRSVLGKTLEIMREYIGDQCEVKGGALTASDIKHYLEEKEIEQKIVKQFFMTVSELEKLQYGGLSNQKSVSEWLEEIHRVVQEIEKGLKK